MSKKKQKKQEVETAFPIPVYKSVDDIPGIKQKEVELDKSDKDESK